jgi:hypothetical protein
MASGRSVPALKPWKSLGPHSITPTDNSRKASVGRALGDGETCYDNNPGAGVTQLVEYLLPKQKVTGSSPVSRSMLFRTALCPLCRTTLGRFRFFLHAMLYRSSESGSSKREQRKGNGEKPSEDGFKGDSAIGIIHLPSRLRDLLRASRSKFDRIRRTTAGFATSALSRNGLRSRCPARPATEDLRSGSGSSASALIQAYFRSHLASTPFAFLSLFHLHQVEQGTSTPSCPHQKKARRKGRRDRKAVVELHA